MKIGILYLAQTNHVVASFMTRGQDPNPTDPTALVANDLPLRDSHGAPSVHVPTDQLKATAASDSAADRVAGALTSPLAFSWDGHQFAQLADPAAVVTWSPPNLMVNLTTATSLKYLLVVQDPGGGTAAVHADSVLADANNHNVPLPVPANMSSIMFVEGYLPIVK